MNPDPISGTMKFKDAVVVATILMLATIATLFLPNHAFETWTTDTFKTAYDLIVFGFEAWITSFVALTGLTAYAKHKNGSE